MSIQERQNSFARLRRMAAARRCYSVAKRWRFATTLGTVALVALAPLALRHKGIREALAIATPLWLVVTIMVLSQIERYYFGLAIRLQEQFDRMVFGLPWNGSLARRMDEVEVVRVHRRTSRRQQRSVENWYPLDDDADGVEMALRCQRGNLTWSRTLHYQSRWIYLLAGFIGAAYGIAFAITFNASLETYLLGVALPSVPGLLLVFESFVGHTNAGRARERVETHIDDLLLSPGLSPIDVGSVQDRIFELRREAPPIPDVIYYATRARMNTVLRTALATPAEELI